MARSFHFAVSGRVQGVFFRKFTKNRANALEIVGWVQNDKHGRVIGIAQGEESALTKFQEALGRGPAGAIVENVEISEDAEILQSQYATKEAEKLRLFKMFRVTPWTHYKPHDHNLTEDHKQGDMDQDVDMEAPLISILQDDKTPPPASSAAQRTSKFRVKLLVNDKKRDPSLVLPEDDHEDDDEEDELIDDEDEQSKSNTPAATRGPGPAKRTGRTKGRGSGLGVSRRKSAKGSVPAVPEPGPVMTWFEVSGADAESGKQGHPTDPWESASVASVNTTSASATKKRSAPKAGVRASRKSVPKPLKVSTSLQREEGDNVSEAGFTGTAASSPVHRENSPDLESIVPSAMTTAPSVSVIAADESLEGVALPVYPLPSKPFPVLPPPKMATGFAPIMPLDKSGKKVRHWRQTNREIRGIAGGRWFARSWAGAKESEYAMAVAASLANPPSETDKTTGPKISTAAAAVKKGKQQKADTAPSSRSSSAVPDLPPNRTTSGPSKMRTSHVAEVEAEEVPTPAS